MAVNLILLDADACIEIIRGNPEPLTAYPEASFSVSWITGFEILSGLKGQRSTKAEERAWAFLEATPMLPFAEEAAHQAARIRILLEESGMRIGAHDTLIAGQALSQGMPILTRNGREFSRVLDLEVLNW